MIEKLTNKDKIALLFMSLLTLIALVYGFSIIPSPDEEQKRTMDAQRVTDLGQLQATINTYYRNNHMLPQTLSDLAFNTYSPGSSLNKTDPQTKEPYGYKITNPVRYQLCATFTTDSYKTNQTQSDYTGYSDSAYSPFSDQFQHHTGHVCFTESINNDNPYAVPASSPIIDKPASPSAVLSSSYKNGNCQWTPTFYLKGFAPYSQIRVYWEGTLSETCTGKANQKETSSTLVNEQTDANGAVLLGGSSEQIDFGEYTYTFSDSEGNSAKVHLTYDPSSLHPTIIPNPNH